nr:MAG TPA: hypothetical protein [Caudoviricetes sp.]
MSEWLVGCSNTHQPPIFTAESPPLREALITSELIVR